MFVLFDECVPRPLRNWFAGHTVRTVQEMGWDGKENGELLGLIQANGFGALVTVDQNLQYQQNLRAIGVAVIIIVARTNRIEDIEPAMPEVVKRLDVIQPGDLAEIVAPGRIP